MQRGIVYEALVCFDRIYFYIYLYVLKEESDEVKQRIHAKSGSLSCVKCYAGYVDCAQGPIRFAILVNNGSTSKMQAQIEGFMKELSVYAGKKK